jgi:hypothetical protein
MYYLVSTLITAIKVFRPYFAIGLLSVSLMFSNIADSNEIESGENECVILLHGLARTSHSMDKMESKLLQAGYLTANIDYPSRSMKIQDLSVLAVEQGLESCRKQSSEKISFVTHSMGGILVRYYLAKNTVPELFRVVMLAPPNQGSKVTDRFHKEQWYKWITGPAGQQLGTGSNGIPGVLGPVSYETGVIAGDVHSPLDNWLSEIIPGEDDGKVSVDTARVDGMRDFIVLPYTHISIMKEPEVIIQTLIFLGAGKFRL